MIELKNFKGYWNPESNLPTSPKVLKQVGDFLVVNKEGISNISGSSESYQLSDKLVKTASGYSRKAQSSTGQFNAADFTQENGEVSLNTDSPKFGADIFIDSNILGGLGTEESPLTIENLPLTITGTQLGDNVTLFLNYKDQVISTFSFTATGGSGGGGTPEDDLQLGNIMLQSAVTSTASSFFPGEGPELSHDYINGNPNLGTNWTSNNQITEGNPQFLQFDMGAGHSRKPNRFRMQVVKTGDPEVVFGRAPKRFQVWGSNDALFSQGSYTVLLNETNNTTIANQYYQKDMSTPTRFRYFRVVFLELLSSDQLASVTDIQMLQV